MTELADALFRKLYGIYQYGAAVFDDGGPALDIDCHVILNAPPTSAERKAVLDLHKTLAEQYPPLGAELDAYYILYNDAQRPDIPQHQIWPDIYDNAWALHCAHVRAGRYRTLYGAEPDDIFPAPKWPALAAALDHELDYVKAHLQYPAFCILNLCRLMYSFQTRDVVVSKRFSGRWAAERYPQWEPLIAAAERRYEGRETDADNACLAAEVDRFLAFAEGQIAFDNKRGKQE